MMRGVETWRDAAAIARFGVLHLAALAVFWMPFSWSLVGWLAGSYVVRMFGVLPVLGIARDQRPFVERATRQAA